MAIMRSSCLVVILTLLAFGIACSPPAPTVINTAATGADRSNAQANAPADPSNSASTVANKFTAADIAKLKWLEGTWRGVHENQPFFERYRFEDTAMVVETLSGDDLSKIVDTSRFELTNGEFGHAKGKQRSAATEITDQYVQFVPVAGGGNNFRFERQSDGTWRAVLEWLGPDNQPKERIYKMEPYKK